MPTLTIRAIPDHVLDRLRLQAKEQRRSINSQVIAILDEALPAKNRVSWGKAYQSFREKWGDSLLTDSEAEQVFGETRNDGGDRDINPFE
ncbi:MAG: Arc family DNA-binding protein [Rhodothermia bacterium]